MQNSSFNSVYLIIILVIVAIFFVIIFGYLIWNNGKKRQKEKFQKQIDQLEQQKNQILASSVEASLATVRKFEQTERINKKYKKWTKVWQNSRQVLQKNMTGLFQEAEDTLEHHQFKEFPVAVLKIRKVILEQEAIVKKLEEELDSFIQDEQAIQKNYEEVKETLQQVEQLFYANKSSLEDFASKIEGHLKVYNKNLYTILENVGVDESRIVEEKLARLKTVVLDEYNLIKELPNAIALYRRVLLPQLKVLQDAYQEMKEKDFLFQGLSLDLRMEKLAEQVEEVGTLVESFDLKTIENKGVHIRRQFEEIQQIFVHERNSKKEAEVKIDKLNQHMNRLRFDKEDFLDEWNKVLKRYQISKEQTAQVDKFSAQVLSAETKMILFNNQYEKNQEAYIVLLKELKAFELTLNELQYRLDRLVKVMETIREDETYIFAQYKQLRYMYHRSKRKIMQVPIDLLPNDYLLKKDEALLSLKEIEEQLNLEVLDVERLTELIEIAQHLAIRFYKDTNMIVKAASFAEKAIIYSNRYLFDKDVRRNLSKAEYLYNQGDYTEALDIALSTLEEVEPGIYQTLFDAYEHALNKEE